MEELMYVDLWKMPWTLDTRAAQHINQGWMLMGRWAQHHTTKLKSVQLWGKSAGGQG